jgi:hypothetical protein
MDEEIQKYPAWRFHATDPACVVEDEAADQALGEGWVDSPGKLPTGTSPTAVAPSVATPKKKSHHKARVDAVPKA